MLRSTEELHIASGSDFGLVFVLKRLCGLTKLQNKFSFYCIEMIYFSIYFKKHEDHNLFEFDSMHHFIKNATTNEDYCNKHWLKKC